MMQFSRAGRAAATFSRISRVNHIPRLAPLFSVISAHFASGRVSGRRAREPAASAPLRRATLEEEDEVLLAEEEADAAIDDAPLDDGEARELQKTVFSIEPPQFERIDKGPLRMDGEAPPSSQSAWYKLPKTGVYLPLPRVWHLHCGQGRLWTLPYITYVAHPPGTAPVAPSPRKARHMWLAEGEAAAARARQLEAALQRELAKEAARGDAGFLDDDGGAGGVSEALRALEAQLGEAKQQAAMAMQLAEGKLPPEDADNPAPLLSLVSMAVTRYPRALKSPLLRRSDKTTADLARFLMSYTVVRYGPGGLVTTEGGDEGDVEPAELADLLGDRWPMGALGSEAAKAAAQRTERAAAAAAAAGVSEADKAEALKEAMAGTPFGAIPGLDMAGGSGTATGIGSGSGDGSTGANPLDNPHVEVLGSWHVKAPSPAQPDADYSSVIAGPQAGGAKPTGPLHVYGLEFILPLPVALPPKGQPGAAPAADGADAASASAPGAGSGSGSAPASASELLYDAKADELRAKRRAEAAAAEARAAAGGRGPAADRAAAAASSAYMEAWSARRAAMPSRSLPVRFLLTVMLDSLTGDIVETCFRAPDELWDEAWEGVEDRTPAASAAAAAAAEAGEAGMVDGEENSGGRSSAAAELFNKQEAAVELIEKLSASGGRKRGARFAATVKAEKAAFAERAAAAAEAKRAAEQREADRLAGVGRRVSSLRRARVIRSASVSAAVSPAAQSAWLPPLLNGFQVLPAKYMTDNVMVTADVAE